MFNLILSGGGGGKCCHKHKHWFICIETQQKDIFFFMFKETKYTPNIQIKRKILHFFLNLKKKKALYTEYLLIETLKYN